MVIGAGLVGLSCAWHLRQRGHAVLLIDGRRSAAAAGASGVSLAVSTQHGATQAEPSPPLQVGAGIGADRGSPSIDGAAMSLEPDPTLPCGSEAALGVLMARVFHRSSGRGWRLRQRSLELWQHWRSTLAERGQPIPWRPGLLLLASGPQDLERQQILLQDRRRPPGCLQVWDRHRLEPLLPRLPQTAWGGLYSGDDGQLEPQAALQALEADGRACGVEICRDRVEAIETCGAGWRLHLGRGGGERGDWLVLAAGLGSTALLPPDLRPGEPLALEPVLGQAVELELATRDAPRPHGPSEQRWPGAVVLRGMNLIQRRSDDGRPRLWLGATLEPGLQADPAALHSLRQLEGLAPDWLERAEMIRHWQGWRARPVGRPAPLLEQLAPRLLLASGHYRNGVLLAPATAEWVAQQIEAAPAEP